MIDLIIILMDGISSTEESESMLKVILISKDLIMYFKNDRSIIYIILSFRNLSRGDKLMHKPQGNTQKRFNKNSRQIFAHLNGSGRLNFVNERD